MAEEAFALSPISASPASPTDADYEAIREAFMEASRGRWFLTEYARRNRNADTAMVLEAVTRIEQRLAAEAQSAAEAQAAVPQEPEGLPEAVCAALEQARATIRAEFSEAAFDHTFLPWRKGLRIIREVIWGLRESGSDPRICNILDGQVRAIEAACDEFPLQEICQRILTPIDELLGDAEAAATEASATSEGETVEAAALEAVAIAETEAITAPAETVAGEVIAVAAVAETAEAAADAKLEASVSDDVHIAEGVDALILKADTAETAAIDIAPAPAMTTEAASETPNIAAAPQPAPEAARLEAAASEAVMPEVVTPEAVRLETAPPAAIPAATDILRPVTILNASASQEVAAQPMAEPQPAHEAAPDHATAASLPKVDPATAQAATAADSEPVATEDDLWADIETEIAPLPALENGASLGATLIAQGVVRPSAATADLLAPIRRMSHAERIAFFS